MNKTKAIIYAIVVSVLTLTSCTTTKDEPKPTIPTTVTDIDGNIYHTVTIGTQTWLVENLKTTKYRNGDLIGTTIPATKNIVLEITPKYQWAWGGDETGVAKYGRLYTWYAVTDNRNIAPVGWHIPSVVEWDSLYTYVSTHYGTSLSTQKALAATTDWITNSEIGAIGNNLAINNYSGFNALPGGNRLSDGSFANIAGSGYWWLSNDFDATSASLIIMMSRSALPRGGNSKSMGCSIRCIMD